MGKLLEGIVDVGKFKVGHVYDVGPRLAELFIVSGCAALERRRHRRDEAGGDSVESV